MGPRRGSRAVAHCSIAVAIGASAWGLVGCGADPGDAEAGVAATGGAATGVAEPVTSAENGSSATTAPQAFVFESGTLEIGDFDPYTLGDNIFDPCTEITPAEFAAAGFDRVEPLPEEYAGLARGLSVCEVLDHETFPIAHFSNNTANRALIEQTELIFDDWNSSLIPEVFVYGPAAGSSKDCYAQVDTHRGGLSAAAGGEPGAESNRPACEQAIEMIESLMIHEPSSTAQ